MGWRSNGDDLRPIDQIATAPIRKATLRERMGEFWVSARCMRVPARAWRPYYYPTASSSSMKPTTGRKLGVAQRQKKPTPLQKEIAKALGVSLRGASVESAASRIRARVAAAINPDIHPRPPTEKQIKFARDLGVYTDGDTFEMCRTKIQDELTRRNELALRRLRLKPGDVVEYVRTFVYEGETSVLRSLHVVSSIGKDLRVYFKNPAGESGGWPSQLTKVKKALQRS